MDLRAVVLKDAVISSTGKYRYELARIWDKSSTVLVSIGLNPSTADAKVDDHTIRRLMDYARTWKHGGLVMLNLFAYRSTDPRVLCEVADPIGSLNNQYLEKWSNSRALACWGATDCIPGFKDQVEFVRKTFNKLYCLGLTKDGHPKHPLYLAKDLTPIRFI